MSEEMDNPRCEVCKEFGPWILPTGQGMTIKRLCYGCYDEYATVTDRKGYYPLHKEPDPYPSVDDRNFGVITSHFDVFWRNRKVNRIDDIMDRREFS